MYFRFSPRAEDDYKSLPPVLQRTLQKQLRFLISDLRHPSLHAKKYDESIGLWQARVNKSWRFFFHLGQEVLHREYTKASEIAKTNLRRHARPSIRAHDGREIVVAV